MRVIELRVMVIVKFLFLFMSLLNLPPLFHNAYFDYRRLLSKVTLNSHFIIISCDVFIMKDLRSRQRYRKKSFTVKDQIREYPIKTRIEEYYV